MSVEEILFQEAIQKGELVQFLGGFPGYYIQPQAADLPTEYDAAFLPIRIRVKEDVGLRQDVLAAIESLASNPEYGWGAMDYLVCLALMRQYEGIDLLSPALVSSVADSLRRNRDALKSLKRWIGKNREDGVWSMVRVNNRILHQKYNITVLPEEL